MCGYFDHIGCDRKKRYLDATHEAYERTIGAVERLDPVDHIRHLRFSLVLAKSVRLGDPDLTRWRKILERAISRAEKGGPNYNDGRDHRGVQLSSVIKLAETRMKEWCVQDPA